MLCDLEGPTYEQAARPLGWTVPALRCRLARARQRPKGRLLRRGMIAPAIRSSVSVPPMLAGAALSAATGGSTSAGASLLTHTLLKGMLMTKLRIAGAAALAGLALASAAVIASAAVRLLEEPQPGTKPKAEHLSGAFAQAEASEKPSETVEIRGRVVASDGKPVAGAAVGGEFIHPEPPSLPKATTDKDGRFAIRLTKLRSEPRAFLSKFPWLVASAPGHGIGWAEGALRADRPAEQVVTLTPEGPPIEGRIVDLEGRPVVGATVNAITIWYDEKRNLPAWIAKARNGAVVNLRQGLRKLPLKKLFPIGATTDGDGRFKLAGIGRDRIAELMISGPGIATTQVHAFSRAESEIRSIDRKMIGTAPFIVHAPKFQLAVMPSKRIEGVARDKDTGEPIGGVLISAAVFKENNMMPDPGIEATTDAEGRYRLDGLPTATAYRLFVRPGKGLPYPNATLKATAITPALEPVPQDFALKRGVIIRGKVTDKVTGRPIIGYASYYAMADNPNVGEFPGFGGSNAQQAPFGVDGSYELVALPGRGLIVVRDEESRYLPASGCEEIVGYDPKYKAFVTTSTFLPAKDHAAIAEVDADPKVGRIALDLQADPGKSARIEVVDPDGRPLGGNQVKGMSGSFATGTVPQESAGFEVHAIDPARPRRLIVMNEGRKLIGSTLLKGDEAGPIRVKLAPWGTLTGRIVSAEGKPLKKMFLVSPGNEHPETDAILPRTDWNNGVPVGDDGRFLIEGLVPGLRYAAITQGPIGPEYNGDLFEGVVVAPGEDKDLGDLKVKPAKL